MCGKYITIAIDLDPTPQQVSPDGFSGEYRNSGPGDIYISAVSANCQEGLVLPPYNTLQLDYQGPVFAMSSSTSRIYIQGFVDEVEQKLKEIKKFNDKLEKIIK